MAPSTPEQSFLAYRRTGDPDALAAVFDATAGKLLLVAAQLAGSHAAEDLVQRTWLCAIEKAASWRRDRPLFPWLVGILVREVRDQRRRNARRPDPTRLPARATRDPADETEARETIERITTAIDALPAPYRQVLNLKLVHGLDPVAIARALEVPAATVRVRLHRGLQRLRRALPSLAGVLVAALSDRALAAVRARVLGAATGRASPAAPAPGPSLPGTGLLLRSGLLLAAATGLVFAFAPTDVAPPADPERKVPEAASTHGPPRTPAARPHDPERFRRQPVGERWLVHGRIRDAGGEAVVGARVQASVRRGEVVDPMGTATTDARGHYTIDLAELLAMSALRRATGGLTIDATAAGHWPATANLEQPLPLATDGARRFRIDAVLEPIVGLVRGRIVDPRGAPVEGITVSLTSEGGLGARQNRETTGADGGFAIPIPGRSGHTLHAGDYRRGCVRRSLPDLEPDSRIDLGTLDLRAGALLAGRLSVADGTPLRRYRHDVRPIDWERFHFLGDGVPAPGRLVNRCLDRTDEEGRFRAAMLKAGEYRLRVYDEFGDAQEHVLRTGEGPTDLQFEGQLVTVRVRDAAGSPLPGARLGWKGWPAGDVPDALALEAARHGEGILPVPEDGACDAQVLAHPSASRPFLVPHGSFWIFWSSVRGSAPAVATWRAEPGAASATVTLQHSVAGPRGRLAFELVDDTGQPVTDYEVTLRHPLTLVGPTFSSAELPGGRTPPLSPGPYRLDVRAGRAQNTLRPHLPARTVARVVADRTTVVRLRVRRGGLLRLHLRGHTEVGTWQLLDCVVDLPDGRRRLQRFMRPAADGPTWTRGSSWMPADLPVLFTEPLPPGTHALTVRAANHRPVQVTATIEPGVSNDVHVRMVPEDEAHVRMQPRER